MHLQIQNGDFSGPLLKTVFVISEYSCLSRMTTFRAYFRQRNIVNLVMYVNSYQVLSWSTLSIHDWT